MLENFLWVEKYRPKTIKDTILPSGVKKILQDFVTAGDIPNLILAGSPGTGKTTVARALCNDLGFEVLFLNASTDNGIDTIRVQVTQFCSTVSLSGGKKVVILDEADNISSAAQDALRGVIEEFSRNARFILTANYLPKIKPAIQSRFHTVTFDGVTEKVKLMKSMFARCKTILEEEHVTVQDQQILVELIGRYYPDFRKIINVLQSNTTSGVLTAASLVAEASELTELSDLILSKEWVKMRTWVGNHSSYDPVIVLHQLWNEFEQKVPKEKLPGLVMAIAEYQYRAAFSADREILLVAALTELMNGV